MAALPTLYVLAKRESHLTPRVESGSCAVSWGGEWGLWGGVGWDQDDLDRNWFLVYILNDGVSSSVLLQVT